MLDVRFDEYCEALEEKLRGSRRELVGRSLLSMTVPRSICVLATELRAVDIPKNSPCLPSDAVCALVRWESRTEVISC